MAETSIEWTDYTFNPWSGCTKVNAGCKNCYAEVNYSVKVRGVKWGPSGNRILASDAMWKTPIKWNRDAHCPDCPECGGNNWTKDSDGNKVSCGTPHKRPRVFCASLADVFEDWLGPILNHHGARIYIDEIGAWCSFDEWELPNNPEWDQMEIDGCRWLTMDDVRRRLFALIDATPNLDWLLLTKRPENIRDMWPYLDDQSPSREVCQNGGDAHPYHRKNLWLGSSGSDQETADKAWQNLQTANPLCRHLFLSLEPLTGPIDLEQMWRNGLMPDWIIVGGESGPKSRPCRLNWIRSIVNQCSNAGVPCFVKQLGSNALHQNPSNPDLPYNTGSKKGGDWDNWGCIDLKVRQFPGEVS